MSDGKVREAFRNWGEAVLSIAGTTGMPDDQVIPVFPEGITGPTLTVGMVRSVLKDLSTLTEGADTDKPWTELAAALYQACGAYDLPERILDILALAASDEPFGHLVDGLLPCCPEPAKPVGFTTECEGNQVGEGPVRAVLHPGAAFSLAPKTDLYAGPQSAAQVPWAQFPAWLINNCEGDVISEERLQRALADMLAATHPCHHGQSDNPEI